MCVDGNKWKSIRGEKIETFKVPEGSGSWSWRLLWVELSSSSRTATNGLFSWSVPFWDVYFVIETRELDLDWKLFQLLAACSPWGGVYWIQFNAALSTFCMNDAAFSGSSFCVSWWTQWCCFHFYLFSFMSGFFASFHQTHDLEKVIRAVRTRPSLLARLQMVQQSFVYGHITRESASLHSLSVHFRIHLKIFLCFLRLLMVRVIQLSVSRVLRPEVTPQTKRWQILWSRCSTVWISYRLT